MIYYTNTTLTLRHLAFIGRWSPFHKGHVAIIQKKKKEFPALPVLIMVRDSDTEQFSTRVRAELVKRWMTRNHIRGTIMIVPNIYGIYWGRGVGYERAYVEIPEKLQNISGTHIRETIQIKHKLWEKNLAHKESGYLLTPKISGILEHGLVVWLTGPPASGKTTIANLLIKKLTTLYPHIKTQFLDGDAMRSTPMADTVSFSTEDRDRHILRMAYLAKMFADHGILVVCAFVSPHNTIRTKAKRIIGGKRFMEVFVKTSLAVRMRRDTKGLYKKAQAGHLSNLTGFNESYEPPVAPEMICNNDTKPALFHVNRILTFITQ